jgi:hypothetical protein
VTFYQPLSTTGIPFSQRAVASEFETAIGMLITNFQELETVISVAVGACLKADAQTTLIVTAEASFKNLVHQLGALARRREKHDGQPTDSARRLAQLDELLGLCFSLEDERNRLIHSFWPAPRHGHRSALRLKWTAKKAGLRGQREEIDAGRILDVADYAYYLAMMIEEYFDLPFGAADDRSAENGT